MRSRSTSTLNAKLERNLRVYATAASAASLGMAALSQPAQAKVVYTPIQLVLAHPYESYRLDLNNDGIADFLIIASQSPDSKGFESLVVALPTQDKNGVEVKGKPFWAGAMIRDAQIGPRRQFQSGTAYWAFMAKVFYSNYSQGTGQPSGGHWINAKGRFLGLKFQIDGKTHYGWCRMNVLQQGPPIRELRVKITGYAYETEPNKPIVAGDKGAGASLGHLALGAATSYAHKE